MKTGNSLSNVSGYFGYGYIAIGFISEDNLSLQMPHQKVIHASFTLVPDQTWQSTGADRKS